MLNEMPAGMPSLKYMVPPLIRAQPQEAPKGAFRGLSFTCRQSRIRVASLRAIASAALSHIIPSSHLTHFQSRNPRLTHPSEKEPPSAILRGVNQIQRSDEKQAISTVSDTATPDPPVNCIRVTSERPVPGGPPAPISTELPEASWQAARGVYAAPLTHQARELHSSP